MPAMRCSDCGVNFPLSVLRCRGCGLKTSLVREDPDPDWEVTIKIIRQLRDEALRPLPHVISIDGKIDERDGNYFVSSIEVCRSGFQAHLEPDTLIQVGHQVFEVGGYSESRREYWLILFNTEMSLE